MVQAKKLDEITGQIVDAAIQVHRALGPGLLESAYEACLVSELVQRGFLVERQKDLPVVYRDTQVDCGYRLDLLVEGQVIVEVKAVDKLAPIHDAQVITYLRLSGTKVGLPINFNVSLLKDGLRRLVNDYPETLADFAKSANSANSAVSSKSLRRKNELV